MCSVKNQPDTGAAMQKAIEEGLQTIKTHMPETYRLINAKAQSVGKVAFALVRRGLAGYPNSFWACERGWVVGTAFVDDVGDREARMMVAMGSTHVCIWGRQTLQQPRQEG